MYKLALALAFWSAVSLALATRASTPRVDWNALADVDTIEVVTSDPDGSPHVTTVWLAVADGEGYIRSSGTRWLANLERDPDLLVRIGAEEIPLRAVRVSDSQTREEVSSVFREKYGISDTLTGWFRSLRGVPTVLRLEPRTSLAPGD